MFVSLIDILAILCVINFLSAMFLMMILCDEYDNNPPVLCQQPLWVALDDIDINFIGKLILCVLTIPFTIFYTVVVLIVKIGKFIVVDVIWKLFCLVFTKR